MTTPKIGPNLAQAWTPAEAKSELHSETLRNPLQGAGRFLYQSGAEIVSGVGDTIWGALTMPEKAIKYWSGVDRYLGQNRPWTLSGLGRELEFSLTGNPVYKVLDTAAHLFYGAINTVTAGIPHQIFNEKLNLGIHYFAPPPKTLREGAAWTTSGFLALLPLRAPAVRAIVGRSTRTQATTVASPQGRGAIEVVDLVGKPLAEVWQRPVHMPRFSGNVMKIEAAGDSGGGLQSVTTPRAWVTWKIPQVSRHLPKYPSVSDVSRLPEIRPVSADSQNFPGMLIEETWVEPKLRLPSQPFLVPGQVDENSRMGDQEILPPIFDPELQPAQVFSEKDGEEDWEIEDTFPRAEPRQRPVIEVEEAKNEEERRKKIEATLENVRHLEYIRKVQAEASDPQLLTALGEAVIAGELDALDRLMNLAEHSQVAFAELVELAERNPPTHPVHDRLIDTFVALYLAGKKESLEVLRRLGEYGDELAIYKIRDIGLFNGEAIVSETIAGLASAHEAAYDLLFELFDVEREASGESLVELGKRWIAENPADERIQSMILNFEVRAMNGNQDALTHLLELARLDPNAGQSLYRIIETFGRDLKPSLPADWTDSAYLDMLYHIAMIRVRSHFNELADVIKKASRRKSGNSSN